MFFVLKPCLCACVVYMPLLLTLGVAGGLTAYSGGLLHSVTQSRASTGTFHWSGSAFIKSCTTAREEYLAGRLVGTCCRHRAPWRNSLFWVYRTHAVNIRVECVLGGRWKKHMRRHQTHTHTRGMRQAHKQIPEIKWRQSYKASVGPARCAACCQAPQTTTSTTADLSRWNEVTATA